VVSNRFETIPPFQTPRLILRPLARTDAPRIQEIGTDEVFQQVPEIPTPFDAETWVDSKFESAPPEIGHVVVEKHSEDIIGYCQVAHGVGDKDYYLDIGYWLGRDYWGKGYATEAVRLVLSFVAHNKWTKYPMFAMVSPDNAASRRVLEKCGFALVAPKPAFLKDDSLLAYEWTAGR